MKVEGENADEVGTLAPRSNKVENPWVFFLPFNSELGANEPTSWKHQCGADGVG